jgi:hypothetical protein
VCACVRVCVSVCVSVCVCVCVFDCANTTGGSCLHIFTLKACVHHYESLCLCYCTPWSGCVQVYFDDTPGLIDRSV